MKFLIEDGYTFYQKISLLFDAEVIKSFDCCNRLNLIKLIADQAEYNMIKKKSIEFELEKLFSVLGFDQIVFVPFERGILFTKYITGVASLGSRFDMRNSAEDAWTRLKMTYIHEITSKKLRDLEAFPKYFVCLLYTSPSPRDLSTSRMPSSA
eukprot:TRINITY_DN44472_c0_g1_i1.p2 TRINITY_DN44472_c0_g1~~TRINITY_DN44472_c0_g1_i1.p2  ORF type:complete len:153 (-),score=27.23 TRINITY_DN44472_c0_g1_i1:73-531(-)